MSSFPNVASATTPATTPPVLEVVGLPGTFAVVFVHLWAVHRLAEPVRRSPARKRTREAGIELRRPGRSVTWFGSEGAALPVTIHESVGDTVEVEP